MTTTVKRTTQGQFAKGVSGNPAGRPKSASVELRRQLAEHGPALVSKAVELALDGDAQALRICLDRIAPALKPTAAPVTVDLPDDAGLAGTARAFVEAAAQGRLAPDVAGGLVQSVAALARIVEIDELERRVAALEGDDEENN